MRYWKQIAIPLIFIASAGAQSADDYFNSRIKFLSDTIEIQRKLLQGQEIWSRAELFHLGQVFKSLRGLAEEQNAVLACVGEGGDFKKCYGEHAKQINNLRDLVDRTGKGLDNLQKTLGYSTNNPAFEEQP